MSSPPRPHAVPPAPPTPPGAALVAARDAGPAWAYELRVAAARVPTACPALVGGLAEGAGVTVPDATSRDPDGALTVRRSGAGFALQRGGHAWSGDDVGADLAGALAAVAEAARPGVWPWVPVHLDRPMLAAGRAGA